MIDPLSCLAAAIYFESGSESLKGKIAVAKVIMNRVEAQFRGEKTVCGIIKDHRQFSFYSDGKPESPPRHNELEVKAWEESYLIASSFLAEGGNGSHFEDTTKGSLHYHASWLKKYPCWHNPDNYIKIDQHLFIPEIMQCVTEDKKAPVQGAFYFKRLPSQQLILLAQGTSLYLEH